VKRVMNPEGLPRPGGAYSLVVRKANLVFVAGLVGMDAERRLAGDDIQSQTQKALENLRGALAATGATLDDVCSVTVFLANADRDWRRQTPQHLRRQGGREFGLDPRRLCN